MHAYYLIWIHAKERRQRSLTELPMNPLACYLSSFHLIIKLSDFLIALVVFTLQNIAVGRISAWSQSRPGQRKWNDVRGRAASSWKSAWWSWRGCWPQRAYIPRLGWSRRGWHKQCKISAKSFRLHSVMPLLQEVSIPGLVRSCLVFSYLHYPFSHSYLESLWRPCSGQYVQALQTKITQHELQALKVPC